MKLRRLAYGFSSAILSLSSLFVLAPTVVAAPDVCTWTGVGGDANMSTAGNWSGCDNGTVPEPGDSLTFPSSVSAYVVNNDLTAGTVFQTIRFEGALSDPACNSQAYTISGNSFGLSQNFDFAHTGTCSNGYTVTISAPYINGNGATQYVDTSGSTSSSYVEFTGGISGSSTLWFRGNDEPAAGNLFAEVVNVNSSVALGIDKGAQLSYRVTDCNNASIGSNLQISDNAGLQLRDSGLSCTAYTLNSVTLAQNASLDVNNATATVTNWTNPSSGYTLGLPDGITGKIIVDGQTLVADYETRQITTTVGTDSTQNRKQQVTITSTGSVGTFTVNNYGVLKGTGPITTALTVQDGGVFAPGNSPGCMDVANLTIAGTYQAEIQGTTVCSGYDSTNASGTVDLTGATLDAQVSNFVPAAGQTYTIINKTSTGAVTGTFDNLAEGASLTANGVTFTISYVGGDGNDVVLTVTGVNPAAIPGVPNTGLELISNNPLVTLIVTLIAVAGLSYAARKQFVSNNKR